MPSYVKSRLVLLRLLPIATKRILGFMKSRVVYSNYEAFYINLGIRLLTSHPGPGRRIRST